MKKPVVIGLVIAAIVAVVVVEPGGIKVGRTMG